VRQWLLLKTLCSHHFGLTVKEAAEAMGVSQKTIRRDLESFQEAGFPLQEYKRKHGCKAWRIEGADGAPGLSFAFDEAIALYLGRHLLEPLAGTPFWQAAQQAFQKIRASSPRRH
jgi:predicted DNA-binding transcriptional regulator YafY